MDRKTKIVTTPTGRSVELNEFISAGEFIDLNEESEKGNFTKTTLAKRTLELAVVSIDNVKENIPALLRDLPLADYTFLNKEVSKLIAGDFTEAKTQGRS
jgi:hypothetical protein